MAALGTITSTADVPDKAQRSGVVTLGVLDLTKAVSFSSNMPSASYQVFTNPVANLAVVAWPSGKTTSGFTLNLSVGVVGDVAWLAVQD